MVATGFWVGKLHSSYVLSKGAHSALIAQSSRLIRKRKRLTCQMPAFPFDNSFVFEDLETFKRGSFSRHFQMRKSRTKRSQSLAKVRLGLVSRAKSSPRVPELSQLRAQRRRSLKQRNAASSRAEKPSGSQAATAGLQQQFSHGKEWRFIFLLIHFCPLHQTHLRGRGEQTTYWKIYK